MSAFLLAGDAMLRMPSARIAKDDVVAFRKSAELLAETKALKENAALAAQEAERLGFERGRDQALDEMRDALSETLAQLSSDFSAENARRERDVAAATMRVVEQLIDRAEDADVVAGLARSALGQVSPGARAGAICVHVAPQWADSVARALADTPEVLVEPDAALGQMGCRVISGEGRIIADLETQLAALRERWGLTKLDTSADSDG